MQEVLREQAIVLENIQGDSPCLILALQTSDACGECPANSVCNTADSQRILELKQKTNYKSGDKIWIEVKGERVLLASFLVYGLPLLMFCTGTVLGMWIFASSESFRELFSFILGISLAALVYLIIWLKERRQKKSSTKEWLDIRIVSQAQ
jgi:positive regulator of sigma E activity